MILKKQVYQTDKKKSPVIGLILFLISVVLLIFTAPLGFVYGLLYSLLSRGFKGAGEYLLKVAISIDQLGNVIMQHLLNALWTKRGGYPFGNRDETISSALGRNKKLGSLTGFGKIIDKILDVIDPNHSLDSIDYYIEPTDRIIEVVAWIHLVEGKILCARSNGKELYYIPGGKREVTESEVGALIREIHEELSIQLLADTLVPVGIFEAQADGQPPGTLVRMSCYTGNYTGTLEPASEISEIVWLTFEDRNLVAPVDQLIFDFLYRKGLLQEKNTDF